LKVKKTDAAPQPVNPASNRETFDSAGDCSTRSFSDGHPAQSSAPFPTPKAHDTLKQEPVDSCTNRFFA
jgi:hypothetical protein